MHDAYPLPRIDESLEALAGSKYFSTLDLMSGYWQVPLDEDAKDKSAFCVRGDGKSYPLVLLLPRLLSNN